MSRTCSQLFARRVVARASILCSILLAACGSTKNDGNSATSKSSSTKQALSLTDANGFKVGVNVTTINNWDENRPFRNLIYGTTWQMQNTNPWGGYEDVPAASLDANGWVSSLPAGYRVVRNLSIPAAGGDFICRYDGKGPLTVTGPTVSSVITGSGSTRFTLAASYPNPQPALVSYTVDPANYIRNIDCRETSAPTTETLAPEFANQFAGFKVVRFMKWQPATEGNWPVSWAKRNKPGDGDYLKNDGVPVEVIVQTANQLGTDAWVTVPWNADDDYVTRFATYVRDNLAPGHRVYVEISNEVWNQGYPVAKQACDEAKAENLPGVSGGVGCNGERYVEKTKQVMQIWSSVFASQMNRLVRVAAFQHVSPYWSNLFLQYQNLYQSIDALATAPYFGDDLAASLTFDQVMAALPGKLTDAIAFAVQQKANAQKYGLRYITYEGGQGAVFPSNVALSLQVQRDPRMYDLYKQFLTSWRDQIGDTLNLFALNGGAWGLSEYAGQPITDAPKMRAVKDFLGVSASQASTPPIVQSPTQVCRNGTVIPQSSSCPA